MEEERPLAQPPNPRKNPYQKDPVFDSTEERDSFVDSCNVVKIPASLVKQPMKNVCTCEKCGDTIEWKKTPAGSYEHICCRQMKTEQTNFSTDNIAQCVTESEAYIAVTNKYAVHNVLLMSKQELSDQGLEMQKPPSNDNWRFGCYKAASLLLEGKVKQRVPLPACVMYS